MEARTRFLRGRGAIEAGRWADALGDFEESYRLSGIPAALYNAATSLRALGRHRDARDALRQVLARGSLPDDLRERAETRLVEEQSRVVVVTLAVHPPGLELRVALDGAPVEAGGDLPTLETDAGEHTVQISAEGYEPFTWRESLSDGEARVVRASLELAEVRVVETEVAVPFRADDGIVEAFLISGGALVVAVIPSAVWWANRDDELARCGRLGLACGNADLLETERGAAAGLTIASAVAGALGFATALGLLAASASAPDDDAAVCAPTLFGAMCAARF